jgi:hypothetical protein
MSMASPTMLMESGRLATAPTAAPIASRAGLDRPVTRATRAMSASAIRWTEAPPTGSIASSVAVSDATRPWMVAPDTRVTTHVVPVLRVRSASRVTAPCGAVTTRRRCTGVGPVQPEVAWIAMTAARTAAHERDSLQTGRGMTSSSSGM